MISTTLNVMAADPSPPSGKLATGLTSAFRRLVMLGKIKSSPRARHTRFALLAGAATFVLAVGLAAGPDAVPPTNGVYRAFPQPNTDGMRVMPPTTLSDQQIFVNEAGQLNLLEIRLGTMALQKSGNAGVRQYADRMIAQHTRLHQDLANLANIPSLQAPTSLDASDAQTLNRLEPLQGADFDNAYLKTSVSDHQAAIAAFQNLTPGTASSGTPPSPIVEWARQQVPLLNSQLALGQFTAHNLQNPENSGGR
jgi:putative membrane protein